MIYLIAEILNLVVMSQKNKAPVFMLSLMMTIAIVGTGIWWFASRSGAKIQTPPPPTRTLPNAPTPKPPSSSF